MNYITYSSRVPNSQERIDPAFSVDVGTAPASIGQIPDSVSFDEINDGATPILSGRVAPDTDGMRSKFLSYRNHVLSTPSTVEHLIHLLVYQNLF